jgi:hypothetical protein
LLGFAGAPEAAVWLEDAAPLLSAESDGNVLPHQAAQFVDKVLGGFGHLQPHIHEVAAQRAQVLLAAHNRVREAAHGADRRITKAEPQLPADVLGIYVLLPLLAV